MCTVICVFMFECCGALVIVILPKDIIRQFGHVQTEAISVFLLDKFGAYWCHPAF